MFCVIQGIQRKKPTRPGEYKELNVYPLEMSINGVPQKTEYRYEYAGGRFERPIRTAYKVSIHESKRVHGVVTKNQYAVTTMGYYDLAEYGIDDCIRGGVIESIAERLEVSASNLRELIYAKISPLQKQIEAEFEQSVEFKTHAKHKEILKEYHSRKAAFSKRYGVDEYDCCYNVYGEVMNQAYLDEIKKASRQREQAHSGYYESASSNYDYSRLFTSTQSAYSSEDRERLKRFYKSLSKIYHPDLNRDTDTHAEMVLLNRLKEEWGV